MIRDLGDGLLLRHATVADAHPLETFIGDACGPRTPRTPAAPARRWPPTVARRSVGAGVAAPGWRVRPADETDVPFLIEVSAGAAARSVVTVPRDAALWRYELAGAPPAIPAARWRCSPTSRFFGFRSLWALETAFPDCLARTDEARQLLDALFSRRPSDVWLVL